MPEGVLGPQLSVASFGFSGAAVDSDLEPAIWTVRIDGPFGDRSRLRAAEPPAHLRLPARGGADETRCARTILGALARRAYRRPVTDGDLRTLLSLLRTGTRAREASSRESSSRLRRILVSPEFLFRIERDPCERRPGDVYRLHRSRARVPPVVLPVEQHPGRRAARSGRARQARRIPQVLEQQVRRMLADARAAALVENFAGQWLYLRNMRARHAGSAACSPNSTTTSARRSSAKPSSSSRASCARIAASLDLLTSDYTFVNERLARHYGIPNIYGSHFRRVTLADAEAARAARPGQHPDGHVVRDADVAGPARQVAAREPPGRAAAAAAAERAGAEGERRRRGAAELRARADGAAPQEPGLRELPRADGSAGLRARELRRGRQVAHRQRSRDADRRVGGVADGDAVHGSRSNCAPAFCGSRRRSSARSPRSC